MGIIRMKLSNNILLLILNLNLFVIQYFVFMSWTSKLSANEGQEFIDDTVGGGLSDSDEVQVYNGKLHPDDTNATVTARALSGTDDKKSTWDWDWDGRTNSFSTTQRFIYLIRHGQYYGTGEFEKHLSPLGKIQAQKTGERLRALNITFQKFISSMSIRAAETADIIHKTIDYLDIEYSEELKEGWPTFPDPASPGSWNRDDPIFNNDMPRIKGAFEKYIHRADPSQKGDSNELFVAHGNIIAYFILRSLQLPPERWLKIAVLQGSISLLQLHPNGDVTLRFAGDIGHFGKREWSG